MRKQRLLFWNMQMGYDLFNGYDIELKGFEIQDM